MAVIFLSHRTAQDAAGYEAAVHRVERLAKAQPSLIAINSVRDSSGPGVTMSYWSDDASARSWRDHPEHRAIRDAGRQRWYHGYDLHVARIERCYEWSKD